MVISQVREKARKRLAGKWGKSAVMMLLFFLISMAVSLLSTFIQKIGLQPVSSIIEIAWVVVSIPIAFGIIKFFMKLYKDEKSSVTDFLLDGFSYFKRSWCIAGNMIRKMIVPIVIICVLYIALIILIGISVAAAITASKIATAFLVLIIACIIGIIACLIYLIPKSLLYSMSYYIAIDQPETSAKDCVQKSEELMKGHRGQFFLLYLSFIGWAILATICFGIGFLWLLPYIYMSCICFYYTLKEENSNNQEVISE